MHQKGRTLAIISNKLGSKRVFYVAFYIFESSGSLLAYSQAERMTTSFQVHNQGFKSLKLGIRIPPLQLSTGFQILKTAVHHFTIRRK